MGNGRVNQEMENQSNLMARLIIIKNFVYRVFCRVKSFFLLLSAVFSAIIYLSLIIIYTFLSKREEKEIMKEKGRKSHKKKTYQEKAKEMLVDGAFSLFGFLFPKSFTIGKDESLRNLSNKEFVTISNHLSDFDWLFIWYAIKKLGYINNFFIVMKDSLRSIPIVGYVLEFFGSIFLSRESSNSKEGKKSRDLEAIEQQCKKRAALKIPFAPLLFPEGTYIYSEALTKSKDKYVELLQKDGMGGKNLYFPEHTLLPRIGGFGTFLLLQPKDTDFICDITLFTTPYEKFVSEKYPVTSFVFSGIPSFSFNMLIKKIEIPDELRGAIKKCRENEGDVQARADFQSKATEFINGIFKRKEEMIKRYVDFCKKSKNEPNFEKFVTECLAKEEQTKYDCSIDFIRSDSTPSFYYFLPAIFAWTLLFWYLFASYFSLDLSSSLKWILGDIIKASSEASPTLST